MFCFVFDDLLRKNQADRADHAALEVGGQCLTYREVNKAVNRLAGSLHHLGMRKGDRVCIHLQKSIDEVIATFAVSRLGAVYVNLNPQLTTRQLQYAMKNARVRFAFMEHRKARALGADGVPDCLEMIVSRGSSAGREENAGPGTRLIAWSHLPDAHDPPAVRLIDRDLCAVLYTSGSTGMPKGVMLSHQNVVHSGMAAARHLQNRPDDRIISVLPLSFDYGLSQLTSAFLVGATLVLQPVQAPAEIVKTLQEKRITGLATVPTLWIPLTRLLDEHATELPHLRYVAVSGGLLPTDVLRAWKRVFPNARKYVMYGMTEAFRTSFLDPEDFDRKMGSIGKPLPNVEVFVVDPGKGICGPNERGELLHRGSLISMGYLDDPEATAEKFKPSPHLSPLIGDERVFHSGDTVFRDDEGYLWFVARTTTFIKCSDFRVSPTEVENLVFESGKVDDVVAFGVPDEMLGQVVHVAVSERPGSGFDERGLMLHCRRQMPTY
jgi:amino acid adenylation domain-containing protein